MKKLLLFAAALFGVAASAQHFGATAGVALMHAKVTYSNMSSSDSQTGGYAGLFGEFDLGSRVKFAPGVNYVFAKGSGAIEVPLMFKFNVANNFNLQAGPQFLFDTSDVPDEWKDHYNKTNFGLAVGAGYDFTPNLFLEARYGFQLNNIFKNIPSGLDVSGKLNIMNIGLGYRFK